MSEFKIQMPKLGESVQEATITKWFIKEGDKIAEDDILFEVATDKVDSEIPSPVDGVVTKLFFAESALVPVGETVALIRLDDDDEEPVEQQHAVLRNNEEPVNPAVQESGSISKTAPASTVSQDKMHVDKSGSARFYSPLVLSIAQKEGIGLDELENITGSGQNGRVQKQGLLNYIQNRQTVKPQKQAKPDDNRTVQQVETPVKTAYSLGAEDQVIEMDRVRKLIAAHMVKSKQISAHVTAVVEADVTNLVLWRNRVKDAFSSKYQEKLTYMPVFTEAVAKALTEFPLLNSSVEEDRIIIHKNINIGIAVAKPDGNLVVPVIREVEQKNLVGIAKGLNFLAVQARANKLLPDDYTGGTFTITNFGSFRNLIGTPIINQPQVAILATGSIEKKPAVMETPTGDAIVVRHKMFLSLSYDHRIIDGALGGAFLRRIADILEAFDPQKDI